MWAKFVDENTIEQYNGKYILMNEQIVANPKETHIRAAGYLPLDTTAIPEGWTGPCRYEAADGVIRAFCEE